MTKTPSIEERLSIYKVPCDCPKGGLVGDAELPCEKCDGSEWMIPDNITQALTAEREAGAREERTRIAQALGYLIDTNNNGEPIKLGDLEQMILHPYTPAPFIQRPTPPTQ